MKTLEERFNSMLKPRATATDIQAVIGEIDAEIEKLEASADQAHTLSLDSSIADEDAQRARSDESGYRFAIERWTSRRSTLAEKFAERTQSDAAHAQRQQFDAAAQEAQALAAEIKQRVPEIFAELTALLCRIKESDVRVSEANRNRPGGEACIVPAEQQARGYIGVGTWPNMSPVERLTDIPLPRLEGSGRIWPPEHAALSAVHEDHAKRAAHARKVAEEREASKRRYVVQRTDFDRRSRLVTHADGFASLNASPATLWLYPEQVKMAEANRMTVTPADGAEAA